MTSWAPSRPNSANYLCSPACELRTPRTYLQSLHWPSTTLLLIHRPRLHLYTFLCSPVCEPRTARTAITLRMSLPAFLLAEHLDGGTRVSLPLILLPAPKIAPEHAHGDSSSLVSLSCAGRLRAVWPPFPEERCTTKQVTVKHQMV